MTLSIKIKTLVSLAFLCLVTSNTNAQNSVSGGDYTVMIDGYDWGPAVDKVVLPFEKGASEAKATDFRVRVERGFEGVEMATDEAGGERKTVYAYPSDKDGNRSDTGTYLTLTLFVGPDHVLGSPIKYVQKNGRGSNRWIEYGMVVTHLPSGQKWNTETRRMIPPLDKFDLKGKYVQNDITLSYGTYVPENTPGVPKNSTKKLPLIIWLHGGGEGGSDPGIALIANKAFNYASEDIQSIFGGAYVLAPQTPTFWMQSATGGYTMGETDDIYHEALMGLIKKYVTDHPNIDKNRIYIGGCSNGGYMSLKLLMERPNYFAAAFISALAYHNQYVTDAQVKKIKDIPIWFIHSADDRTTLPEETVLPLYERLKAAGAKNTHLSFYDHVTDITGFFGGDDYRYPGHWSWIYSHANQADFDVDRKPVLLNGRPVTIMEWMAGQKKKRP